MKNAGFRALFKPKRTGGNIHFSKVVLILMLISVMVLGDTSVINASESVYYYNKYQVEETQINKEELSWVHTGSASVGSYGGRSKSYTIDRNAGKYEGVFVLGPEIGDSETFNLNIGDVLYRTGLSGEYIQKAVIRTLSLNNNGSYYGGSFDTYQKGYYVSTQKSRGSLIQSNIKGVISQYPSNGVHTDGYWYIRGVLVNENPTITLSNPSENSYFGKEGAINLQGIVRDIDSGDILSIKYTISGISEHTNKTLSPTITANGDSQSFIRSIDIDSIIPQGDHILKVWVEDNKGGKSTEVSRTIKIDKTNPTTPTIVVNENWSKEDVIATITPGTDAESGVDRTEYSLSGATTLGWTTYSKGITISNEGITTIKTRTIDNVGNISNEASKNVRIDKTKPKIKITIIRN